MFGDPSRAQPGNVFQHVARLCRRPTAAASASMNDCTPRLTRFTPHAASASSTAGVKRPGRALDRDFCVRAHVKLRSHRGEDSLQLPGLEHCGRSAAEVDRVHFMLDLSAHLLRSLRRTGDVRADTIDVALEYGARKTSDAKLQ